MGCTRNGSARHIDAVDSNAAIGRFEQCGQDADERGLPGAVGSNQAEDFALGNIQREIFERDGFVVFFAKIANIDHRACPVPEVQVAW